MERSNMMLSNKRILVTGGAGFLGYHVANAFARRGVELTLIDIAKYDPGDYPKNVELLQMDVRDLDGLNRLLSAKSYDLVIHAAAALPLWKKREIFDVNINGTSNVLKAAKANNVERVIYISSTAVYGIPKKHPIEESDKLNGVGAYGESKIKAEQICGEYRSQGFIVSVLRPKTFIGTGRLGVFQILYDWVESGKRIPMIGSGKNHYQLLEVEDLVEAIWLASFSPPEKVNDTFNIGATEFGTVYEDLMALCEYANTGARVLAIPAWFAKGTLALLEAFGVSPLYKWVYGTADKDSFVSTEKIQVALGWKARFSNAQALIRSYQWYIDNKETIPVEAGVTHRVAWNQGALRLLKRWL